jgi:hypothetical protein
MPHPFLAMRWPFLVMLHPFVATRRPFVAMRRPFVAMLCPFGATRRPFVAMLHPFLATRRASVGYPHPQRATLPVLMSIQSGRDASTLADDNDVLEPFFKFVERHRHNVAEACSTKPATVGGAGRTC